MNDNDYSSHWEQIRSNWVNGNLQDAKDLFYQQTKNKILRDVKQAIDNFGHSLPSGTPGSGDLIDLREIITAIIGR